MQGPNLATALKQAGSAVKLLWKPNSLAESVPVVPAEFSGWRVEQRAWDGAVALLDLSHHMMNLLIEGPDATRLLSHCSANNYEKFAVGQAKQFVAVSTDGYLIQDGILVRLAEDRYDLIGIGTSHNWVMYHATAGEFAVKLTFDPPSNFRQGNPPEFRYQVQGPKAAALLEKLLGNQLEGIKFFHFREVSLNGNKINALRHGMAGQAGFEFFGPWDHSAAVRDAILEAGAEFGIEQVGGLAYYSAGVDSGWLPTPVAAVYTQGEMEDFRQFTSLYSYEGMAPLHGSFYSPDIRDYYCTPYELGYGRSVSFNHEFVGREALMEKSKDVRRKKVTLIWNADDVRRAFGEDAGFFLSYTKDRVEKDGELVGISQYATSMDIDGTIHSLALLNNAQAEIGTQLTLIWGQHPGPEGDAATVRFDTIRVTVAPAPLNEVARTSYRAD